MPCLISFRENLELLTYPQWICIASRGIGAKGPSLNVRTKRITLRPSSIRVARVRDGRIMNINDKEKPTRSLDMNLGSKISVLEALGRINIGGIRALRRSIAVSRVWPSAV